MLLGTKTVSRKKYLIQESFCPVDFLNYQTIYTPKDGQDRKRFTGGYDVSGRWGTDYIRLFKADVGRRKYDPSKWQFITWGKWRYFGNVPEEFLLVGKAIPNLYDFTSNGIRYNPDDGVYFEISPDRIRKPVKPSEHICYRRFPNLPLGAHYFIDENVFFDPSVTHIEVLDYEYDFFTLPSYLNPLSGDRRHYYSDYRNTVYILRWYSNVSWGSGYFDIWVTGRWKYLKRIVYRIHYDFGRVETHERISWNPIWDGGVVELYGITLRDVFSSSFVVYRYWMTYNFYEHSPMASVALPHLDNVQYNETIDPPDVLQPIPRTFEAEIKTEPIVVKPYQDFAKGIAQEISDIYEEKRDYSPDNHLIYELVIKYGQENDRLKFDIYHNFHIKPFLEEENDLDFDFDRLFKKDTKTRKQTDTQQEQQEQQEETEHERRLRKQQRQKRQQRLNRNRPPNRIPSGEISPQPVPIPLPPMATPIPLPPIGGWQQVPGQLLTPPPRSTPASPITRLRTPSRPANNIIPFPGTQQQTQTPPTGGSGSSPPSPPDFSCEQFGACARRQLPPILRQSYQDDLRPALDAWFNARLEDIRNTLRRVENNTVETLNRIGAPNQGVGGQRTLFKSIRYVVGNVI
ncbi:MAG: hypothetical protein QXS29_10145 [Nitrososphaeria archaeon]